MRYYGTIMELLCAIMELSWNYYGATMRYYGIITELSWSYYGVIRKLLCAIMPYFVVTMKLL